jgi:hypothetical protein
MQVILQILTNPNRLQLQLICFFRKTDFLLLRNKNKKTEGGTPEY